MHPTTLRAASSSEAAIDSEVYGSLAETMEDAMASLMEEFLHSTDGLLTQLEAAEAAGDALAVRLHAHSIKSSAAAIGALPLSELASALEIRAASGPLDGLQQSGAALRLEFGRVRTALQRIAALGAGGA